MPPVSGMLQYSTRASAEWRLALAQRETLKYAASSIADGASSRRTLGNTTSFRSTNS
jgi:hypothetical protein